MPGFCVVFGVGEVEIGAAFAAEEAVVDIFEEFFDGFGVGCAFFVAICPRINGLGLEGT